MTNSKPKLKIKMWHLCLILIMGQVIYFITAINGINPIFNAQMNWTNQQNAQEMNYYTHAQYVPAQSTCTNGFLVFCDQWTYTQAHVQAPMLQEISYYNGTTGQDVQCDRANSECGAYAGFNQSVMPPDPTTTVWQGNCSSYWNTASNSFGCGGGGGG